MKPYRIFNDVYIIGSQEISHSFDCCVYVIDAHPDLVLIDSGAGNSFNKLVQNIRALKLDPANLKAVIATHAHIDHIGSLGSFHEKFGVEVIAHELDADAIENGKRTAAELYGIDYKPCRVDVKIEGSGKTVRFGLHELKLMHIPGHTPGSIAVYVDMAGKRVLFGQDIHGPYYLEGADPGKAKASLLRLIDLKADILCEGHYAEIESSEKVRRYIESYLKNLY